jgi:hypothetical protein
MSPGRLLTRDFHALFFTLKPGESNSNLAGPRYVSFGIRTSAFSRPPTLGFRHWETVGPLPSVEFIPGINNAQNKPALGASAVSGCFWQLRKTEQSKKEIV